MLEIRSQVSGANPYMRNSLQANGEFQPTQITYYLNGKKIFELVTIDSNNPQGKREAQSHSGYQDLNQESKI